MERRKPKIRCWVCERIVDIDRQDSVIYETENDLIGRHGRCAVGSTNWLKSDVAKKSKFYKYFKKEIQNDHQKRV